MNSKTTTMHKAAITQDIRGSPSAWGYVHQLFSYLLSFVNHIHAQSQNILLCIRQDIYRHSSISSFLELVYNTKPYTSLLHSLALALSSASVQHNMHKALTIIILHLAKHHVDPSLHRLDIYLYITKRA
jgi:hypothetical protein